MSDMMNITLAVPMPDLAPGASPLVPQDASAAIITVDGKYLMQHRDNKPWIFCPDHWGLFGGAFEADEDAGEALRRELHEELGLTITLDRVTAFCTHNNSLGEYQNKKRVFFEMSLQPDDMPALTLGEGQAMGLLTAEDIFHPERKVCPYDAFALWMHIQRRRNDAVVV